MAYIPRLEDLDDMPKAKYRPSLSDLEEPVNTRSEFENIARNIAAGGLQSVKSLFQSLPDLSKMTTPKSLQKYSPFDAGGRLIDRFDPYSLTGTKEQPFYTKEGAEQTVGELFPFAGQAKNALRFGGKLLSPITNAFKKINPQEIAKSVQSSHDFLQNEASHLFDTVNNEATKRGIRNIPIDKKMIEEAIPHFPKTRNAKKLIEEAKKGDYQALRDLQSDLWKKGTKATASPLAAENNAGEEIFDLRNRLNESIGEHFEKTGNKDLKEMLQSANNKYRNLKDTYYSHNTIAKLVDPTLRKVPKNILNVLAEDSVPMQKVREANPLIERSLSDKQLKENAIKRLKMIGYPVGTGAAVVGLEPFVSPIANKIKNAFTEQ